MPRILVSREAGRSWFVRDPGKDFATHFGTIAAAALQAASGSTIIAKDTKKEFAIFDAGWSDVFRRLKRLPQMMPLKDIGLIIAETGIGPQSVVVDGGTGSGALACALAHIAKHVTTYEIREDCLAIVKENIAALQLSNVTIKAQDMTKGIDERDADLVTIDLPEPWHVLPHAAAALKPGGWLASYSPQITQSQEFVNQLSIQPAFLHVKTVELLERPWRIEGRVVRPRSVPIAHSGFITFARKIMK